MKKFILFCLLVTVTFGYADGFQNLARAAWLQVHQAGPGDLCSTPLEPSPGAQTQSAGTGGRTARPRRLPRKRRFENRDPVASYQWRGRFCSTVPES